MTEQPHFADRISTPPTTHLSPITPVPSVTARVLETVQTVLTALILAFAFRAFFVEQFVIPTGSMAPTLLGQHATHVCPACGWQYDFGPAPSAQPGGPFVRPPQIVCPNCQLREVPTAEDTLPKSGDRILVHKWAYALGGWFQPQRWDVILFRDPADPSQHFVKRLVALPGESIEIADGDVFINGAVARKPDHVQRGLWFVVFDQAHFPNPAAESGKRVRWTRTTPGDALGWSGLDCRTLRYDAVDDVPRALRFNAAAGREYLRDFYAYNRRSSDVLVGDVRLVGDVEFAADTGALEWEIQRGDQVFQVRAAPTGRVELMRMDTSTWAEVPLGAADVLAVRPGRPFQLEFAHVDYRVYVRVDGHLVLEYAYEPPAPTELRHRRLRPVELVVRAVDTRLALARLRIDRDVYYTDSRESCRATTAPFELDEGEYFVLGDNSPDSFDSREWTEVGPHLPRGTRPGVVRADQIVGQAAFVYLPGLLPLHPDSRWRVPDVGRMRFVR